MSAEKTNIAKILLVSGDETVLNSIDRIAARGYHSVTCRSAKEAFHLLQHERYSLVVIDNLLEDMDGLSFIHILRGAQTTRETSVAMIYAEGDETSREEGSKAGVCAFIGRPFEPEELAAFVDRLFKSGKLAAQTNRDKVMVIEDSRIVCRMYAQILAQHKYDYRIVMDSTKALEEVKAFMPDLILMDANMPVVDGFDLTRLIMENRDTENIRIVMVTADTKKKSTLKALEYGVVDFLTKPFDEEVLVARMRTHLNNKRLFDDLEKAYEEMKILKDKLELLSITDGLTGLFNHRHFHDTLAAMRETAVSEGSSLSLLLYDIDGFKKFNDVHGHKAGDAVLRAVAGETKRIAGVTGVAARYGGEEFAVLLPGSGQFEAMNTAEAVRSAIEKLSVEYGGKILSVTVSIGVAVWDFECTDHQFIESADKALYKSKADGKNRATLAGADSTPVSNN